MGEDKNDNGFLHLMSLGMLSVLLLHFLNFL